MAKPSIFGRSLRFLRKLRKTCLLILYSSCFAVRVHNISLRIAIASSLLFSFENFQMSHTSSFVMPPINTFHSYLYISHPLTTWVLLSSCGPHGHIIVVMFSFPRRWNILFFVLASPSVFRKIAVSAFSLWPLGSADTFAFKVLPSTASVYLCLIMLFLHRLY